MRKMVVATLVLAALGSAACRDSTGVEDRLVTVRFSTDRSGAPDTLVLAGTNGTLRIDDLRFLVSGLRLERAEGSCTAGDDGCKRFGGGPFLVDLPLGGNAVALATGLVARGTYTVLGVEVEDLIGDDAAERDAIQRVVVQLRQAYPDAPREASMVVRGSFTPVGSSTTQPFTVYFDAEASVEMELVPSLPVPGATTLTVLVDPALWFRSGDEVLDLAARNGQTLELTEIEQGFTGVGIED
jgi:hypothetical protein